jgi:hypothetical protein
MDDPNQVPDKCFFPQVDGLAALEQHYPHAVYLLPRRDPDEWVRSVEHAFHYDEAMDTNTSMAVRIRACAFKTRVPTTDLRYRKAVLPLSQSCLTHCPASIAKLSDSPSCLYRKAVLPLLPACFTCSRVALLLDMLAALDNGCNRRGCCALGFRPGGARIGVFRFFPCDTRTHETNIYGYVCVRASRQFMGEHLDRVRHWARAFNATLVEYDIRDPSPLLAFFSDTPRACWPHANKNRMLLPSAQVASGGGETEGEAEGCFRAEGALATIRSLRATLLALDVSCGDRGVGVALGLAQRLEEQLGGL